MMDLTFSNKHNFIVEFLNTFFVKFWGTSPLIALTIFGNKILLFIVPGEVDGWLKLAVTSTAGVMTLAYMSLSSKRKARHEEERHKQELEKQRQELAQDKMDAWISQYHKALEAGIIKPESSLADFIKQIETIEAASLNKFNKTR